MGGGEGLVGVQGTAEDNIVQMQSAQQAAHSAAGGASARGGGAPALTQASPSSTASALAHGGDSSLAVASQASAPVATRRSHCLENCW